MTQADRPQITLITPPAFELELFPDKNQFPIKKGDVIALSGNTGGSGGPHLHFEVYASGRKVNPLSVRFSKAVKVDPGERSACVISTNPARASSVKAEDPTEARISPLW